MARPRLAKYKSLPPYLYVYKRGAKSYFSYRHPKSGKLFGMGSNRAEAIQAAQQLNSQLLEAPVVDLVRKVMGGSKLFANLLDEFLIIQNEKGLSAKNKKVREWRYQILRDQFGERAVMDITTQHIAEFLDTRTANVSNTLRSELKMIFDTAIAKGYLERNPAAVTQPRIIKVQRGRLSKEQFDVLYAIASPTMKNAMILGLLTLQRRQDIVDMQFAHIVDGHLQVVQSKTGQKIRIKVAGELADVIERCRATGVVSDYLVHNTLSRKGHRSYEAGQPLQPSTLSAAFLSLWTEAKFPNEHRPSFHEIRSLGARLLEAKGFDPQKLLGHQSRKMTEMYLNDRGSAWTDVELEE